MRVGQDEINQQIAMIKTIMREIPHPDQSTIDLLEREYQKAKTMNFIFSSGIMSYN